jgi:hypothetical protein
LRHGLDVCHVFLLLDLSVWLSRVDIPGRLQ